MDRLREAFELTRVRVLLFLREPEAIFWVFVFPLVLAAVLGFAFREVKVPRSRVAVLAGERAAHLAEELGASESLEIVDAVERDAAERGLRSGAFDLLIEPDDPPRLLFNPDRPESETARLRVLFALQPPAAHAPAEAVPLVVPGSRYIDFLFPGLLGMNLMGTGMWSVGFAVAELRQRKLLRRLLVTPMRRSSFLGSFLVARLVSLSFELLILALFGILILDVPFRGSLAGFLLVCLLGAMCFSGLGLLAVARVKTIQGASGMLNVVMMPMWLGAGVFFSYERFPAFLHPLLRLIPLTSLNDALRALMLDGASLASIALPLAILAAWGALGFAAALKLFRWE